MEGYAGWDPEEWRCDGGRVVASPPPKADAHSRKLRKYQTFGASRPRWQCMVDGCTVSVRDSGTSRAKQGSQRSRVCVAHKKAAVVVVDGLQARYCQQCLRLHLVEEFDGERRACRKRLYRHRNRRARRRDKDEPTGPDEVRGESAIEAVVGRRTAQPCVGSDNSRGWSAAGGPIDPNSPQSARAATDGGASPPSATTQRGLLLRADGGLGGADCCLPDDAGRQRDAPLHRVTAAAHSWNEQVNASSSPPGPGDEDLATTGTWREGDSFSCLADTTVRSRSSSVTGLTGLPLPETFESQDRQLQQKNTSTMNNSSAYFRDSCNDELLAVLFSAGIGASGQMGHANASLDDRPKCSGGPWEQCMHATMKMAHITPEALPSNLLPHLNFLLEALPVDVRAAMRPGCVHLSVDLWFRTPEELRLCEAEVQQRFLDVTLQMGRELFWARQNTHVLLPCSRHQVSGNGEIVSSAPLLQRKCVERVSPIASDPWNDSVTVLLRGVTSFSFKVAYRLKGRYYWMDIQNQQRHADGSITCEVQPSCWQDECGLAWLEVVEEGIDSSGFPRVSSPHPMLLTDYHSVATEVSTLFGDLSLEQSQQQAGLLKALECALHSHAGGMTPSERTSCAHLLLMCAQRGMHQTVNEVVASLTEGLTGADLSTSAADLLAAVRTVFPDGLLAAAVLSGSPATIASVAELLLDADPSLDLQSALTPLVGAGTALAELVLSCSPSAKPQPHATCAPVSGGGQTTLYASDIVTSLKRPLAPVITLVIATLAFSCLPWTRTQSVCHTLMLTALLHGMLPFAYRVLYELPMRELRKAADEQGLLLAASTPRLLHANVQAEFERQQLATEGSAVSWMFFCGWLVFRIVAPMKFFSPVPGSFWMLATRALLGLLLLPLRFWAIRRRSLDCVRSVNTGMSTLLLSLSILSMYTYWWLIDQPAPLLPFFVSTNPPPWVLMFGLLPVWLLTTAAEVFTLVGPLDPTSWVTLAHCASSVYWCGLLMPHIAARWHGVTAPYVWVTWFICLHTALITCFGGLRVWLECTRMNTFLIKRIAKKHL